MTRGPARPPVWRTLPWRALAAGGARRAAAGRRAAHAVRRARPVARPLRAAGRRARLRPRAWRSCWTTRPGTSPRRCRSRRPVRVGLRVATRRPVGRALLDGGVLFLVPEEARPPVGAVTLEAAAIAVFALAAAALAVRRSTGTEPGVAVSAWLLSTAAAAFLLLPDGWAPWSPRTTPAGTTPTNAGRCCWRWHWWWATRACVEPLSERGVWVRSGAGPSRQRPIRGAGL